MRDDLCAEMPWVVVVIVRLLSRLVLLAALNRIARIRAASRAGSAAAFSSPRTESARACTGTVGGVPGRPAPGYP